MFLKFGILVVVFSIWGNFSESACPHLDSKLKKWSEPSSWPDGKVPSNGMDLDITQNILLDTTTADLGGLIIDKGASIVFSPDVPLAKLTARNVEVKGSFIVGAEDCPFTGNAEILLTEKRDEGTPGVPSLGQKVLGVPSGGVLEIHGMKKQSWTKLTKTLTPTQGSDIYTLDLADDVTSWKEGDKLVIASSDYDWNQAEKVSVIKCDDCGPKQVKVQGTLKYTHLGEKIEDVDMRAEVIDLTRNIKFHGKMADSCYDDLKCNEYSYDTFGAHIKFIKGFNSGRIEYVELYDVGQQTILGSYPIHFHMVDEVGTMTNPPYVRGNAIYNSYSRCVTLHGVFGLKVEDNVAYNHLGHCYFIEDGGERRNVLENNIGIGTKNASLVGSDATHVSTFFITSPSITLRKNVAAGSDNIGFLYSFPDTPVAVSNSMNWFQEKEASRTLIAPFTNNVAHSNDRCGLYFDKKMGDGHEILDVNNEYDPRENPLDLNSKAVPLKIESFTAYGNRFCNSWIRGKEVHISNCFFSDSANSVIFASSFPGPKYVTNSVILGETETNKPPEESVGIALNDAPTYVKDVKFTKFPIGGAIGYFCDATGLPSPVSTTTSLNFYGGLNKKANAVHSSCFNDLSVFRDVDGSITGGAFPNYAILKPSEFRTTSKCDCQSALPELCLCPHKYIRLDVDLTEGVSRESFVMTRDDLPKVTAMPTQLNDEVVSFLVMTDRSYILHFPKSVPSSVSITGTGIDKSGDAKFGLCLPKDSKFEISMNGKTFSSVDSLKKVDEDTVGDKYFWDNEVGLVFLRLVNPNERTSATTMDCPGPNGENGPCPSITIKLDGVQNVQADCRKTAYPKYKSMTRCKGF